MLRICIALVAVLSFTALECHETDAHSGRTDSKGGHVNKKTGKYHFHGSHAGKYKKLNGTVTKVVSGDTFIVTDEKKRTHTVRLLEIDAPDIKQQFGKDSKEALAKKLLKKTVLVTWEGTDGKKQLLGHVYKGDAWANLDMVRDCYAWHFTRVSNDNRIADAQTSAQKARKGLWRSKNPIPPWEF